MKAYVIILTMPMSVFMISGCKAEESEVVMAEEKPADPKADLTPMQYKVTQQCGTEPPFDNAYWDNKEPGIYVDIVSGEALFSSIDKFESGSGWPSFTKPLEQRNITTKADKTHGMVRTEVRSANADSHLGHVFEDGPVPAGGLRYCINSAALRFIHVDDMEKEGYGRFLPLFGRVAKNPVKTETAIFAAGCFWGVEHLFKEVDGVLETTVGYTGGHTDNPGYREVCNGDTGHAEAVEVIFDPSKVTFRELTDYFWKLHDPTTANRQGPDIGSQYRSAIFYTSEEQKKIAEESKAAFDKSGVFKKKAVTEITAATKFFDGEDYHQDYFDKHPNHRICHRLREE